MRENCNPKLMIWTTACREGKGVRITWWRHDRRPAGAGRHLLALGALGSLPSRRTKVPTTGKRHTVPLHLSHLSQLSNCTTALVTRVTMSHCAIALVTLCHCTCDTCHTVTLCHCTCHNAPTWQEVILPFSAEGTIVKADSSIMEESDLKPRFLRKILVGQSMWRKCVLTRTMTWHTSIAFH